MQTEFLTITAFVLSVVKSDISTQTALYMMLSVDDLTYRHQTANHMVLSVDDLTYRHKQPRASLSVRHTEQIYG